VPTLSCIYEHTGGNLDRVQALAHLMSEAKVGSKPAPASPALVKQLCSRFQLPGVAA